MDTRVTAAACVLLASLSGCQPNGATTAPDQAATGTAVDTEVDVASYESGEHGAEVEAARTAFAVELGIEPEQVEVVSVEEVTWNDSSLGCSRPGESYLQVLTPGYRIRLEAVGETAVYHTDRGTARTPAVVRCDRTRTTGAFEPVEPPPLPVMASSALEAAREDLQQRLGGPVELSLDEIGVADVTELQCDDATASAPDGGPAKVILELRLRHGDDVHIYRSWSDDVVYCGLEPGPAVE